MPRNMLIALFVCWTLNSSIGLSSPTQVAPDTFLEVHNGRLQISVLESAVWSAKSKLKDADQILAVEKLPFQERGVALKITVGPSRLKPRLQLVVILPQKGNPKTLWKTTKPPKGDPGERVGQTAIVAPLVPSGESALLIGELSEQQWLCGSKTPLLLNPQKFDFEKKRFVAIDHASFLWGTEALRKIRGRPASAGEILAPSLTNLLPASSRLESKNSSVLQTPAALVDNAPETGWSIPADEDALQFVTFTHGTHPYPIKRIVLKLAPASAPPGLTLKTQSGPVQLEVRGEKGQSPIVFDFETPLATTCLSFLAEGAEGASESFISEISALTEFDLHGGFNVLVNDLRDPQKRRAAARILDRGGESAVTALNKGWSDLDEDAKRYAAAIIAQKGPDHSIPLLVKCLSDEHSEHIRKICASGLLRAGKEGDKELSSFLVGDDDFAFATVIRVIASKESAEALETIGQIAGQGSLARRQTVRDQLSQLIATDDQLQKKLLELSQSAFARGEFERGLDLLVACSRQGALQSRTSKIAADLYHPSLPFEHRFRLINLISHPSGEYCPVFAQALDDPDVEIQQIALSSLHEGGSSCPSLAPRRISLVESPAPQVRSTAIKSLGPPDLTESTIQTLADKVTQDPWPHVRASAIHIARHLPAGQAGQLFQQASKDRSKRVRLAMIELAAHLDVSVAQPYIHTMLTASKLDPEVVIPAIEFTGEHCLNSQLDALFAHVERATDPLATENVVNVGKAAVGAISRIGGEQARELLVKARKRSSLPMDRPLDEAIETIEIDCRQ